MRRGRGKRSGQVRGKIARMPKLLRWFFAAGLVVVVAGPAAAEEEFDVHVSGRAVTLTTKGPWHVNQQYPWKLVIQQGPDQSVTLAKHDFKLTEKTAAVTGTASGSATLKGAVCQSGKDGPTECRMIKKAVTLGDAH